MILADTSVAIEVYRHRPAHLLQIIVVHDAAICGVTVAELHAGARTTAEQSRCAATVSAFQTLNIPETLWLIVGRTIATLRAGGLTIPFVDAVLAALAVDLGIELWTYDAHFSLAQVHLPGLRLFQEPP